jgi:hypothetical protein
VQSPVGLDGDRKAKLVEQLYGSSVELEQRLAAREDDETMSFRPPGGPLRGNCLDQRLGRRESPASLTVGPDKIRITEGANGVCPVFFAARPEVAAGESA